MEPVRWGVLGCAHIATGKVIPGMQQAPGTELVAIASRTLAKAEEAAARFGGVKAYGSYEALLADPEIEAVYVPLPNGLHAEWAIKAMRAGKDVLCEKPIAMDAAQAREIQAVREATGRVTLEAFAYRFNPVIAKAIEICASGVLGERRFVHTSIYFDIQPDPNNVRLRAEIGGGALYDVGCYALNLQRMLAGREPQTAFCQMQWSDQFKVDMAGVGTLAYGDDLRGTFEFGFTAERLWVLKVVGDKGSLITPYGWNPPADAVALLLNVGGQTEEIRVPYAYDYAGEVQDLSEHIRGVRPARYLDEPLDSTMRLIDACFRSDKSGVAEIV